MPVTYFRHEPWTEVTYLDEVAESPTVVQAAYDHPMAQMRTLFDSTFQAIFPALDELGLRPVGPAFSLHYRIPRETCDLEVGVPVDRALAAPLSTDTGVTITPSVLPAGRIAVVTHLGSYADLGDAWGRFMNQIAADGYQPVFPFWELYVTEPTQDTDSATLRTDLVTRVAA